MVDTVTEPKHKQAVTLVTSDLAATGPTLILTVCDGVLKTAAVRCFTKHSSLKLLQFLAHSQQPCFANTNNGTFDMMKVN